MGANLSLLLPLLTLDCGIQAAGFAVSAYLQTEKFYDFLGSGAFLALILKGAYNANERQTVAGGGGVGGFSALSTRQLVNSACVAVWAIRLGSFLFSRALKHGDSRFDKVKKDPKTFFVYWSMQAVWVFLTSLPVQLLLTIPPSSYPASSASLSSSSSSSSSSSLSYQKDEVGVRDFLGWGLWACGFFLQVTADRQKTAFKSIPGNKDKFINTGVWAACQHPNYCGEIMMWSGLFVSASTAFTAPMYLSGFSPLLVFFLLRYVSGVPIQQKQGAKRWGHLPEYQAYVKSTPLLLPSLSKLFRSSP